MYYLRLTENFSLVMSLKKNGIYSLERDEILLFYSLLCFLGLYNSSVCCRSLVDELDDVRVTLIISNKKVGKMTRVGSEDSAKH